MRRKNQLQDPRRRRRMTLVVVVGVSVLPYYYEEHGLVLGAGVAWFGKTLGLCYWWKWSVLESSVGPSSLTLLLWSFVG
jgi:hypothetical protein